MLMNYSPAEINRLTEKLEEKVCRDPADNRVLEAAIAGNCEFIITGDKDLLILKKYQTVRILTPSAFIADIEMN